MILIPGKIPIRIFPVFWILILLIGWLNSATITGTLIWAAVIFFSILFHEFGHALTAKFFGQKPEIDLVGLGGVTRRQGGTLKSWQEFLIVMNGPAAGLLLFFITMLLQPFFEGSRFASIAYALEVSVYVNLFWTLLNLLPILPLDGGHLLKVALEGFFGFKGLKIALIISLIFSVVMGVLFFLIQAFLGGAIFLILAFESYRAWSEVKDITSQDTNSHLQELFKEAQEDLKNGRFNDALSKLSIVQQDSQEGVLYVLATQYVAHILAEQGSLQQAYEWLLPIADRLSPEYSRLLQQIAYRLQEWEQAVKIGSRAYQQSPLAEIAIINALCYAIMGKAAPAVGWLRCARQSGKSDLSQIVNRREFDAIRDTPDFQALLRKLT